MWSRSSMFVPGSSTPSRVTLFSCPWSCKSQRSHKELRRFLDHPRPSVPDPALPSICSTDDRRKNSGSMKMEIRHEITKNWFHCWTTFAFGFIIGMFDTIFSIFFFHPPTRPEIVLWSLLSEAFEPLWKCLLFLRAGGQLTQSGLSNCPKGPDINKCSFFGTCPPISSSFFRHDGMWLADWFSLWRSRQPIWYVSTCKWNAQCRLSWWLNE